MVSGLRDFGGGGRLFAEDGFGQAGTFDKYAIRLGFLESRILGNKILGSFI